jgi:asparagine synthase (glutamine-hydrolysing)
LIELRRDGWRVRPYWRLTYRRPTPATLEDATASLRDAAAHAVRSRLADDATTGVLASGGLDSSSIAALASAGDAARVHAFAAVFPDDEQMDESRLISLVTDSLGLPLTTIAVHGGSMLAPALDYLAAWRVPSVSPNLVWATQLARAAGDGGVPVLLDGEGGDELFGYSRYLFADLVRRGDLRQAVCLADRLPGMTQQPRAKALRWVLREWGVKGLLPYAAHAAARRARPMRYGAAWLTPAAARQQGAEADSWAWKRLDGPLWWRSLAFSVTESRQRFGAHDFLRHKSTLAGVEGRHPYFEDVDLIEHVLSLPPELAFDPVVDRPLLRNAMAGRLPDEVRLRREKSYFDSLFHRVVGMTDRDALLRLLDNRAEVAAYARVDKVRGFLEGDPQRPAAWAWIVWRVAMAECWLQSLADPSFAARALAEWTFEPARIDLRHSSNTAVQATPRVSA